ncbi:MAG: hypothetical protein QXM96_00305 [Candidatus Woesearchaeota archaeon]
MNDNFILRIKIIKGNKNNFLYLLKQNLINYKILIDTIIIKTRSKKEFEYLKGLIQVLIREFKTQENCEILIFYE